MAITPTAGGTLTFSQPGSREFSYDVHQLPWPRPFVLQEEAVPHRSSHNKFVQAHDLCNSHHIGPSTLLTSADSQLSTGHMQVLGILHAR